MRNSRSVLQKTINCLGFPVFFSKNRLRGQSKPTPKSWFFSSAPLLTLIAPISLIRLSLSGLAGAEDYCKPSHPVRVAGPGFQGMATVFPTGRLHTSAITARLSRGLMEKYSLPFKIFKPFTSFLLKNILLSNYLMLSKLEPQIFMNQVLRQRAK